jgi:rhomboid family GlyGly-CTERM serine protease
VDYQKKLTIGPAFPWMTLAMALVSTAALLFEPVSGGLIYDRPLIFKGQLWRLWSAHVVHFGLSHFTWNLAVFLPSGIWLERLWPATTRWFYLLSPLIISAALLLLDPTLTRYAGLSGIATGMLMLLACLQLGRRKEEPAWFWVSVLALVGIKMGVELFTRAPVFVSGFGDIRTVPLAHIFGIISAMVFWSIALLTGKTTARRGGA